MASLRPLKRQGRQRARCASTCSTFDLDALSAYCERSARSRFVPCSCSRWIHQRGASDFAQMTDLARSLR
jgi:adenine C2-methylase RlmN of 23S rRNA A2503 and tRNA A37